MCFIVIPCKSKVLAKGGHLKRNKFNLNLAFVGTRALLYPPQQRHHREPTYRSCQNVGKSGMRGQKISRLSKTWYVTLMSDVLWVP